MATYAAMIDRMDQGIGRIIKSLKETKRFDNTLMVFLSDNGGSAEDVRMPGIKRFATGQDTSKWGNRADVMPGGPGTFQSYAIPWANASNTPFRWYKSEVHEGGIATPLIMHWPKGIPSTRRGKLNHQAGHVIDLMATCVDISGASYPKQFQDREVQAMEGASLRGALSGQSIQRKQPLFFEHQGNCAIRDEQWKLVKRRNQPWELYDLKADRTETQNLASHHPKRVESMQKAWHSWALRAKVLHGP